MANLEHYWYMMSGTGLSNALNPASPVDWYRTYTKIPDTSLLDGATYYFEVVCENDTGADQTITLRNITDGTSDASVVVPSTATATYGTLVTSSSFTPGSGDTYAVRTPSGTMTAGTLKVYDARIKVVQANATKTVIQVPHLVTGGSSIGGTSSTNAWTSQHSHGTSSATSSSWEANEVAGTIERHAKWYYDSSWFPGVSGSGTPIRLSAGAAMTTSGTGGIELYNATDSTDVTGARITSISTTGGIWETSFAASVLTSGKEYETRYNTSSSSRTLCIHNCHLWITIATLTNVETYIILERYWSAANFNAVNPGYRHKITTANYSSTTWYPEATYKASGVDTDLLCICDAGTNDSGTSGSNLSPAIDLTTTRARIRDSAISSFIDSGDRVVRGNNSEAGTTVTGSVFMLVAQTTGATHYDSNKTGAWHLKKQFTSDKTGAFHIKKSFTSEKTGAWHLLPASTHYDQNKTGAFHIKKAFTSDKTGAFHIKKSLTSDKSGSWHIKKALTGDKTGSFHIKKHFDQNKTGAFHVKKGFTSDKSGAWHLKKSFTGDKYGAWHIKKALSSDKTGAWSVQFATHYDGDKTGAWHLKVPLTGDKTGSWHIKKALSSDKTGAWHLKKGYTSDKSGAFHVKKPFTSDKSGSWHITDKVVNAGLIAEFVASLAKNGTAPGNNTDPTSTWTNLSTPESSQSPVANGNTGNPWTTSSGWAGSGTYDDPYCFTGDGADDGFYTPVWEGRSQARVGTWEAWAYQTSATDQRAILFEMCSGTSGTVRLVCTGSQFLLMFKDDAAAEYMSIYGPTTGVGWHHVMAVSNGTTATVYVDGVAGTPASVGTATISKLDSLSLACWGGGAYAYEGGIATIRIYDRCLSEAEVLQNYDAGILAYSTREIRSPDGSWHIKKSYSSDKTGAWHLQKPLSSDKTGSWHIKKALSSDKAGAWHISVLSGQTRDISGAWHVKKAYSSDKTGAFWIQKGYTSNKTGAFHIKKPYTSDKSGAWHIKTNITSSKAGAWHVKKAFTSNHTGAWYVRKGYTSNKTGAWHLKVPRTGDKAGAWHVKTPLTSDVSGSWSLTRRTQSDKAGSWWVYDPRGRIQTAHQSGSQPDQTPPPVVQYGVGVTQRNNPVKQRGGVICP